MTEDRGWVKDGWTTGEGRMVNIESFDYFDKLSMNSLRTGIEQGISNYEVEIASSAIGGLAMTNFIIDSSAAPPCFLSKARTGASLGMTAGNIEYPPQGVLWRTRKVEYRSEGRREK